MRALAVSWGYLRPSCAYLTVTYTQWFRLYLSVGYYYAFNLNFIGLQGKREYRPAAHAVDPLLRKHWSTATETLRSSFTAPPSSGPQALITFLLPGQLTRGPSAHSFVILARWPENLTILPFFLLSLTIKITILVIFLVSPFLLLWSPERVRLLQALSVTGSMAGASWPYYEPTLRTLQGTLQRTSQARIARKTPAHNLLIILSRLFFFLLIICS